MKGKTCPLGRSGGAARSGATGCARSTGAPKTSSRSVHLLFPARPHARQYANYHPFHPPSDPQKKALATHHAIAHEGRRDFVCPHAHCARAFGYKHLLQRHLAKLHAPPAPADALTDAESGQADCAGTDADAGADTDVDGGIDVLTGKAYAARAEHARKLRCPHPHLPPLLASGMRAGAEGGVVGPSAKRARECQYAFSRAYDLRRHLRAEHGVEVEREKVDQWVRGEREAIS